MRRKKTTAIYVTHAAVDTHRILKLTAAAAGVSLSEMTTLTIRVGLKQLKDKETILRALREYYPEKAEKKAARGIDTPPKEG